MSGTPSPEQLDAAAEYLRRMPGLCAAFLHGSAATGTLRPDSDLDIALLACPGVTIPAVARFEAAGELAAVFHRPVDLGTLSTRNLVYARAAILHGRLLFTRDRLHSDRFAATVLALYADLQENRKEVLVAYTGR